MNWKELVKIMKIFKSLLSLWKEGKASSDNLLTVPVTKKQVIISALFSVVLAIIALLPVALLIIQFVLIYGYYFLANKFILGLGLAFISIIFIIFNALISLINLIIIKYYLPDNEQLKSMKSKPFFIYQLLNPGFIVFIVVVAIIFGGVI